jgi:hypothetical protein
VDLVIKAFLKSLAQKKARTLLVLFSISVSAALVFANESFARTVAQGFYDAGVRWSGNADFYIQTKNVVGAEEWIDPASLAPYGDAFEYAHPAIREKALYMPSPEQMHYFTMLGVDLAEFNQRNPVTLDAGSFEGWGGNNIIAGRAYADQYGLEVGDTSPWSSTTPRMISRSSASAGRRGCSCGNWWMAASSWRPGKRCLRSTAGIVTSFPQAEGPLAARGHEGTADAGLQPTSASSTGSTMRSLPPSPALMSCPSVFPRSSSSSCACSSSSRPST